MKIWVCEKCNWEGKRPATMGVPGLKVKVCQKCLSNKIHQEDRKAVKQPEVIATQGEGIVE